MSYYASFYSIDIILVSKITYTIGIMNKLELLEYAKPHYDSDQLSKLELAIDIAYEAHKDQKRMSGEPYIVHPMSVCETLISWKMDISSVITGVLHDTLEDTDLKIEKINELFGNDIAELVNGLTKVSQVRAGMKDLSNYTEFTKDNLSKLLIAVAQDVRVIIVKLADRLHNLKTLQYLPKDRQEKIARESLEVLGPMADRLGMGRVRTEIEDLAFSFLNPIEHQKLKIMMSKRLGRSTRKLGEIRYEVETNLKQHNIKAEINGRVKSVYSLYKKLAKVNNNIDDIYDLIALRVVVYKKEDCYLVLGILHSLYKPMISRIKDYIATPKPNGYQSLHTTVMTPKEQIVEFQIRTQVMHEYAERGLAASFHYHDQKGSKDYVENRNVSIMPEKMHWIQDLQEIVGKIEHGEKITGNQLKINLFSDRIFVHSPKGDIYDLPEGALPLDFAYLVHSEIGGHAQGFKVNAKIHPFDKPLQNGDIVEVIVSKNSKPKQAWKKLVTTIHARDKLQGQLRQLETVQKSKLER
jgi:RelA/SpoT family (p)ppGpp synthetase